MNRVHLILVDGMRPDSLAACGNPYVKELLEDSLYTLKARTVFPSSTLPCHMSLFHSVDPSRHGVTTNTFTPQVRPINGICEQIPKPKQCGMVYNWHQLRDIIQPSTLSFVYSQYFSLKEEGVRPIDCDKAVAAASVQLLKKGNLDFLFTYMGATDSTGHAHGWMGTEYLNAVSEAYSNIKMLIENTPDDYLTIIIADHGGHDRMHGSIMEEDMTIPVILHGLGLKGVMEREVSIKDIAPTIVKMLECECAPEWEGTSLL